MTKQECYQWIANLIMAPLSHAHIGYLGEYYCQIVIDESNKLLQRKKRGPRSEIGALKRGVTYHETIQQDR